MSQENEDFLRAVYARFNGGERVPDAADWHADGEYINSRDDPDPGTHRGHDAVRKQFERWVETYPDLRVEPLEVIVNGDRVFVWGQWSGHAAGSGAPVAMKMAQVWTLDGGKIRRCEEYLDRAEALEATGLQE
jgi:ketosteroid isomerase-like protein